MLPIKYYLGSDAFGNEYFAEHREWSFTRGYVKKWAVTTCGDCIDKQGYLQYEAMVSSRTDDFLKNCRFKTLDQCQKAFDKAYKRSFAIKNKQEKNKK